MATCVFCGTGNEVEQVNCDVDGLPAHERCLLIAHVPVMTELDMLRRKAPLLARDEQLTLHIGMLSRQAKVPSLVWTGVHNLVRYLLDIGQRLTYRLHLRREQGDSTTSIDIIEKACIAIDEAIQGIQDAVENYFFARFDLGEIEAELIADRKKRAEMIPAGF